MQYSIRLKIISSLVFFYVFVSCNSNDSEKTTTNSSEQSQLTNQRIKEHSFLTCMYQDSYFPKFLVDKCKNILLELCMKIEVEKPSNLNVLYELSHTSTNKLNNLQREFIKNDSEIETGARECLAMEFKFIAMAYGFDSADTEELTATRNW